MSTETRITTNEEEREILEKSGKFKGIRISAVFRKYGIIFALILLTVIISIASPRFLTSTNIFNVLAQSSIYGIMALGMTIVIISKGIDLSVGSLVAFAGIVSASLGQVADATTRYFPSFGEISIIVPILAALIIGVVLGAINGGFIAFTGIPPFIATLGMMTIARGFTLMYTGGKPVSQLTPDFMFIGSKIGIVPVPVIIYALMIILTWVLLSHTRFGKSIFAIGGNVKAAEISGINVRKNIVLVYAFAGFMCGVAALVFAGRVGSVQTGAATGYELTAIAATTIGGTSQTGGIGTVWGAVVGTLIISVLRNGLTLLGVEAYWQQIVEGAIIIAAVIIDMRKNTNKK